MVGNLFLDIANGLLGWIISGRPAWTVTLPDTVMTLIHWVMAFDNIAPVSETLTCMGLFATLFAGTNLLKWSKVIVDSILAVIP